MNVTTLTMVIMASRNPRHVGGISDEVGVHRGLQAQSFAVDVVPRPRLYCSHLPLFSDKRFAGKVDRQNTGASVREEALVRDTWLRGVVRLRVCLLLSFPRRLGITCLLTLSQRTSVPSIHLAVPNLSNLRAFQARRRRSGGLFVERQTCHRHRQLE